VKAEKPELTSGFGKSGFRNRRNELLDIVTAEIAIRRSPKEREERSALTVFGFRRLRDKAFDHQIHESAKSDLPNTRGISLS
jgi:hypothetical protein